MLRTRGFHHVTMVSADAVRTVRFYRDLLGLRLVKRTVNFDDPAAHHLYFGAGEGEPGTLLTFFEWAHARPGRWGAGGVHHVALGVADMDALLRWKRRLGDAGVATQGPVDRGYFTSLYFTDPDGQVLELATAGPGYAVDEPPARLGERVIEPPPERLPGGRDAAFAARVHPHPVPEVTPEMAIAGIHHVSAITLDLAASGSFYEEALGLTLVKRTLNQDDGRTPHWFWAARDGDAILPASSMTLFGWQGGRRERPGAGVTHHVAFRARDEAEQAAWTEHLVAMGIGVSPVMDRTYFRSIYFRAPDGLLVEIATDGPGFTVDEDPESLGGALRLPPTLERRRREIEAALTPLPV